MRQGHLFIIFVLIACSCFISLYCRQKNYDCVMAERQKIENDLLEAVEYAGKMSRMALREDEEKKKQLIAASFSEAIYVTMGYLDSPVLQEFWRIYVPMLVLVEEDGACFYYVQTEQMEKKELYHTWSDKILFPIRDEYSDAKKKSIIADTLEQKASEIITKHNSIALQYGISYQYYLPEFFQDTSRLMEFPMLFVVFQGWPLDSSDYFFYDACFEAGMFLRYKGKGDLEYPKLLIPGHERVKRTVNKMFAVLLR